MNGFDSYSKEDKRTIIRNQAKMISNVYDMARKSFEKDKMEDMKLDNCRYCDNTGLRAVPNGPDDVDMELCECKQTL